MCVCNPNVRTPFCSSKICRDALKAATHQPAPTVNERPAIQDLVIADIEARKAVGLQRYGTLLQPFNGRDALMDAYQEALDLCQYLRQVIEERDASAAAVAPVADNTGSR